MLTRQASRKPAPRMVKGVGWCSSKCPEFDDGGDMPFGYCRALSDRPTCAEGKEGNAAEVCPVWAEETAEALMDAETCRDHSEALRQEAEIEVERLRVQFSSLQSRSLATGGKTP